MCVAYGAELFCKTCRIGHADKVEKRRGSILSTSEEGKGDAIIRMAAVGYHGPVVSWLTWTVRKSGHWSRT